MWGVDPLGSPVRMVAAAAPAVGFLANTRICNALSSVSEDPVAAGISRPGTEPTATVPDAASGGLHYPRIRVAGMTRSRFSFLRVWGRTVS